ncbi:MAG: hypothetical protein Q7T80_03015 [Methanoregula sp.]|nr:hypothetical protein [Methanoregula sp.]
MAGILYHKKHRIDRNHSYHSYLVDIGSCIEIQLIQVSSKSGKILLQPPFKETRFFIIEIGEMHCNGQKQYEFQNIVPVLATRSPDWCILKFRIKRGSWIVTERIPATTNEDDTQWLYTDDFNILFLSSGGRHDHEMLKSLLLSRLDAIAESILSGTRFLSEFENQQVHRDAFGTMFSGGVDGTFCDAVIYQPHSQSHLRQTHGNETVSLGADICSNHGKCAVSLQDAGRLKLDQIEELNDLSWLTD